MMMWVRMWQTMVKTMEKTHKMPKKKMMMMMMMMMMDARELTVETESALCSVRHSLLY